MSGGWNRGDCRPQDRPVRRNGIHYGKRNEKKPNANLARISRFLKIRTRIKFASKGLSPSYLSSYLLSSYLSSASKGLSPSHQGLSPSHLGSPTGEFVFTFGSIGSLASALRSPSITIV